MQDLSTNVIKWLPTPRAKGAPDQSLIPKCTNWSPKEKLLWDYNINWRERGGVRKRKDWCSFRALILTRAHTHARTHARTHAQTDGQKKKLFQLVAVRQLSCQSLHLLLPQIPDTFRCHPMSDTVSVCLRMHLLLPTV